MPQLLRPKQERAVQTRARILQAAAEHFAQNGFQNTSILDVAQHVGMTRGAVYFHFKDKDDMAIAVVEASYQRWPALLAELEAAGLGPLETLYGLLDRTAHLFCEDAVVRAGTRLQAERTLIRSGLPQLYPGWIERLTELLANGQQAGQVREDLNPAALARVVVSTFFGMQHVSELLHDRADLLERWAEVRQVVFHAIAPH